MKILSPNTIPGLLVQNLPRELVLAVDEALTVGAQRAHAKVQGMAAGHFRHALGQLRHFHMQEAFHQTLSTTNCAPNAIKGNGVIAGQSGILALARFNVSDHLWQNGRRSHIRRQMAAANAALEPLVHGDLFTAYQPPTQAVAFFVACFAAELAVQSDLPLSTQIAVPNRDMSGWLFKEPLITFVQRYDESVADQEDRAQPKLKAKIQRQREQGAGE